MTHSCDKNVQVGILGILILYYGHRYCYVQIHFDILMANNGRQQFIKQFINYEICITMNELSDYHIHA